MPARANASLVQCVPSFLIALHWSRLRAKPTAWGLLLGTFIVLAGVAFGLKRISGVHVGVIGLALNVGVPLLGSWLSSRQRAPMGASAAG